MLFFFIRRLGRLAQGLTAEYRIANNFPKFVDHITGLNEVRTALPVGLPQDLSYAPTRKDLTEAVAKNKT